MRPTTSVPCTAKRPVPPAFLAAASALLCLVATGALAQSPAGQTRGVPTRLEGVVKDDFDALIERRGIRVVAPYSRTLYFNDKGRERGISADFVRDFETLHQPEIPEAARQAADHGHHPAHHPRPAAARMSPRGSRDIAVGNLTVTEERLKLVDFVAPDDVKPMPELVITGPKSPPLASADELAGKTVHVRKASSYYESLVALNDRLKQEGKPRSQPGLVPDALEDEDMMEMLNAGMLEAIVVDDWKARMWAQVLPRIMVNETRARAHRRHGRLGDPQEQPEALGGAQRVLHDFIKKQGVIAASA